MKQREEKSILSELKNMKQRVESLFTEILEGPGSSPSEESVESGSWEPAVDIWETSQSWVLIADLPGVQDDDLRVELMEHQLTIAGKREVAPPLDHSATSRLERPAGLFSRTFTLPQTTKKDSISAELKRGVLTVTLAKEDSAKASAFKIEVKCT